MYSKAGNFWVKPRKTNEADEEVDKHRQEMWGVKDEWKAKEKKKENFFHILPSNSVTQLLIWV